MTEEPKKQKKPKRVRKSFKQKREEKKHKKIELMTQRDNRDKVLLEEADLSEMNTQQKIIVYIKMIFYAGKPFFIYILSPAVAIAIGGILYYGWNFTKKEEYITNAGNFYSFIGICFALFWIFKNSRMRGKTVKEEVSISFKGVSPKMLLLLFGGGFAASFAISAFYTLLPDALMKGYDSYTANVYSGYDMKLAFLSIALLDPIAEEIVFRGYMLNRLLPRLKETRAVWVVTILFSLCHVSPLWIIYGVAMGYILAKISIRHDNILHSIAIHIGFNLTSVVCYLIMMNETANEVMFGNKLMILLYFIVFMGLTVLAVRKYCDIENIEIPSLAELRLKRASKREDNKV